MLLEIIKKNFLQNYVSFFFGDSRAYQWPAPAGLDQFEFINRGIGAQTSAQAVQRFDKHVAPLHPDILLIQTCINDLQAIPSLVDLQSWIISNCKDNIRWIVQKARIQGAIVVLTTIFPQGETSSWTQLVLV
ncbi:MAG: hypothetical protein DCC43_10285 [Candidatus Brocadia sp.]|nr:hypothetical protein [Candidatus Brocadia sp.]MCE7911727.1 hypothetical protein [Candidatus Brocadia sp. AMX3]MDG5995708.1 hypothetical protein [Candidatus Brocadia sp.]RIJ97506.1 MAG: hypothetical protein DCC43_10285 [Candidatus Brocadia sp.]